MERIAPGGARARVHVNVSASSCATAGPLDSGWVDLRTGARWPAGAAVELGPWSAVWPESDG